MSEKLATPTEISVRLGFRSETEFLEDIRTPDNPARRAVVTGVYKVSDEIRTRNIQLAKACSPAAMEQCVNSIRDIMSHL